MGDRTISDATTAEVLDWGRAKDIFLDALDVEPAERRAFVIERCGSDRGLRAAVHRLLSGHESATDFLVDVEDETGASGEATTLGRVAPERSAPGPAMPDAVGPFEILGKIGEGGHGSVYRARQLAPVEREVALKVLKPGLESHELIERFADERRFLARMDHPDIVKILDAGGTPDGRLFVAMDLVPGEPLTEYAEKRGLGVRERVGLVARLARAVQHAHQRAVIHRDLKPTNILVSGEGNETRLRVIDFGIARALADGDGEDGSVRTLRAIGTPRYMSPEQAGSGEAVDTRTDIYAMGVILCELLTGKTPRPPATGERSGPVAATPPSRLAVESSASHASVPLRGDLDRIVLKCVEWEPEQRYASAGALADDLVRYLEGRPVLATPPGAWYVARKFVGRHRVGVAFGVVSACSLIAGLAMAVQGRALAVERAAEAEAARAEAERQVARAEFVTAFLLEDMLAAADPDASPGRDVTAVELLDAADRNARARFADDPATLADVLGRIGVAYTRLGRNEEGRRALTEAIGLAESMGDDGPAEAAELGWAYERAVATLLIPGRHKEAGEAFRSLAERAVGALGPDHPVSLRARLMASEYIEDHAERSAEVASIESSTARPGFPDAGLRVLALRYRASRLAAEGAYAAAVEAYRAAYGLSIGRLGPDHTQSIGISHKLADAMIKAGEKEAGAVMLRDALARAHAVYGPAHGTVTGMERLAVGMFVSAGFPDEAVGVARSFAESAATAYGVDSIPHVSAGQELGRALLSAGRPAEALAELERILPLRIGQWGEDHAQTGYTLRAIADAHFALGAWEEAESFARRAMRATGPSSRSYYSAGETLVRALAGAGRGDEAAAVLSGLRAEAEGAGAPADVLRVLDALGVETRP